MKLKDVKCIKQVGKVKDDNHYKNYTNDELIDEIERGLRKGYWDKRLLPEVRRRFGILEGERK